MKLYLVSCTSKKLGHTARARDLYASPWFRLARRFVESRLQLDDEWGILSAYWGFLAPEVPVDPYELSLAHLDVTGRKGWGDLVITQLEERYASSWPDVVLLAGGLYRRHLLARLRFRGVRVEIPLEGLGIGEQLAWLKRHTEVAA